MQLYRPKEVKIDTRKRRRFYRLIKKVQRISLVILIWMLGFAIMYGIYTAAFIKPFFKVSTIQVKGNLHALETKQIIEESGIKEGDHLLRISVEDVQQKLSENTWIKEVAVHRKLPRMVLIYVNEYKPEALVRLNGFYYVDRQGKPFRKLDLNDEQDFPIITGLEDISEKITLDDLQSKIVEILNVKKIFESSGLGESYSLSEIHYSPDRGISIVTLNDPMELRLGMGPFTEKIERLETVYSAIRSHGGVIAYVDLSSEGKVVVKYGT